MGGHEKGRVSTESRNPIERTTISTRIERESFAFHNQPWEKLVKKLGERGHREMSNVDQENCTRSRGHPFRNYKGLRGSAGGGDHQLKTTGEKPGKPEGRGEKEATRRHQETPCKKRFQSRSEEPHKRCEQKTNMREKRPKGKGRFEAGMGELQSSEKDQLLIGGLEGMRGVQEKDPESGVIMDNGEGSEKAIT